MAGLFILLAVALALLIALLAGALAHEMTHPPRHTTGYALARRLPVDPAEIGLPFESWSLDLPGGVRLAVWDCRQSQPPAESSSRLTAVIIHGWGHSRIDMLAWVQPWRREFQRMIVYDLRGHGESTGPSRLGDGEERDLLALIERLGNDRIVLIGHSMGATIAIRAAASDDVAAKRVVGVIACSPYAEFHPSLQGRLRGGDYSARPLTDLALAWLRLRGIRPPGALPAAASVRLPTLVIHGSDDRMVPIDHARRIAAAAGADLLEADHAGHRDAFQSSRAEARVRRFLAGIGRNLNAVRTLDRCHEG
jgi:pimeloyl-ACP methyl ester carboxylesterase